jgi:hypothetical protein
MASTRANWTGLIGLLGLFGGLCTLFALIFSAVDGWRENAREKWPEATATLERCSVDLRDPYRPVDRDAAWRIQCQVRYRAGTDQIETSIGSRSTSSSRGVELLNQWVNEHESGSAIAIHYDPADHKTAVLTQTDMPYAGPRTSNNLRIVLVCAIACITLSSIAAMLRRRHREQSNQA